MTTPTPSQSRTDSKLQYAEIHLGEIETFLGAGKPESDPYEIAHEESLLFHLIGAKDAFLHEVNDAYGRPLQMHEVSERELAKIGAGRSQALRELQKLLDDDNSWLAHARECRNHGTHRHRVPRIYHEGVARRVEIRHPVTGAVLGDMLTVFRDWIEKMRTLIADLRTKT